MNIQNNFKVITFDIQDGIGYLKVNRPDKLNALNQEVLTELKTVMASINQKQFNIKGIIFTGTGEKSFIAGADIAEMSKMNELEAEKFGWLGQRVTLLMEESPYPIIACVNGFALGGGCEFAMSADFIYASSNAVFGQPEVKLGLIPGFGGTQRLSKYVGRHRARELVYTGRNLKVTEAKEIGLVLEVFDSIELMLDKAKSVIEMISKNSPQAVAVSKKIMNEGNDLTVEKGLELEIKAFSKVFGTPEMKEGTIAFLEKRSAKFN